MMVQACDLTAAGVAWLIAVRAVVSTLLLGGGDVARRSAGPGSFPVDPFFFLIGLTYALTIVYAADAAVRRAPPWLVDLQLGGDALIVSAFIYFTGGITSYFSSLYVLPIVAGEHRPVPARRPAGRDAQRRPLRRRSCWRST